jgi:hypothetical protein
MRTVKDLEAWDDHDRWDTDPQRRRKLGLIPGTTVDIYDTSSFQS